MVAAVRVAEETVVVVTVADVLGVVVAARVVRLPAIAEADPVGE